MCLYMASSKTPVNIQGLTRLVMLLVHLSSPHVHLGSLQPSWYHHLQWIHYELDWKLLSIFHVVRLRIVKEQRLTIFGKFE